MSNTMLERALATLPAIVVATGPSHQKLFGVDIPQSCKVFACSTLAKYIRVDTYALADTSHIQHLPPYPCKIVITHSGMLTWDFTPNDPRVHEWFCDPARVNDWKLRPDIVDASMHLHEGLQTGVFVSMLALREFDTIGLIGFDGFDSLGDSRTENMQYVNRWFWEYLDLLAATQPEKKIVSLMDATVYHERLIPLEKYAPPIPIIPINYR